jgi:hypothetical protein
VVVGRVGVNEVGDPVLGVRVVRLVHLDLVGVVVRRHDRGEPGHLDAACQATEAGEQVDRDQVVVGEPATTCSWAVLGSAGHAGSPRRASKA